MFELRSFQNLKKTPVPLHKYNVDFGQEKVSKNDKAKLIVAILQRPEFRAQELQWATDYSNIIVITKKLQFNNIEGRALAKDPNNDDLPSQPTSQAARNAVARRTKKFKVIYKDTFALQDLISYLRRTYQGQEYQGRADVIQLLNIIVSKPCRDSRLISTGGQNAFFPIQGHCCFSAVDLRGGLSAYRGFFSSVRYSVSRMLVNLNVANGAFFNEQPLRDLINDICGGNPTATDKAALAKVEPIIARLKVQTQYMVPRDANGAKIAQGKPLRKVRTLSHFSKQYKKENGKVVEFRYAFCKDTTFKFALSPGGQAQSISVYDYFKKHYGITLRFPDEPPINVGTNSSTNWLP